MKNPIFSSLFGVYWTAASLVILQLALFWYGSPISPALQSSAAGQTLAAFAASTYGVVFSISIPALVIAHGTAAALGFTGRRKPAYFLSIGAITIIFCVIGFLVLTPSN